MATVARTQTYRPSRAILPLVAGALLAAATPLMGQQSSLTVTDGITFTPGLRVQPRFTYDNTDGNSDFFVARVRFKGGGSAYGILNYYTELKLDNVGRFNRSVSAQIENAWLNFGFKPEVNLRIGLYDAVFSRDALTSDSKLLLMDRSMIKDALTAVGFADNTVGVLVHGRPAQGRFEYSGGLFDNLAFDGPDGNVSRESDGLMAQGRFVFNLLDPSPLGGYGDYRGSYLGQGRRLAIGVSAGYLPDARIVAPGGTTELDLTAFGADVYFNQGPFSAQAEYGQYKEDVTSGTGGFTGKGWYAQGGYLVTSQIELAVRYQQLDPSDASSTDRRDWTSLGGNYYIRGHNMKIQADYTLKHEQGTQVSNDLFQVQFQLDF